MRWSIETHRTRLWNWVANDLGGDVLVMIRGSRRNISVSQIIPTQDSNGVNEKSSVYSHGKSVHLGAVGSNGQASKPLVHEDYL